MQLNKPWRRNLIIGSLIIASIGSCSPDKNDGELGALPKADFEVVQTPGSNSVTLINKTNTPSVAYWTLSNGQKIQGDTVTTSFTFAGTYTATLLVAGRGGLDSVSKTVTISQNDPTACQDQTNVQAFLAGCTQKKWRLMPSAYAEMVGPSAGSGEWWGNPAGDVAGQRACEWNDEYIFSFDAPGTYQFDSKGDFYDDGYLGNANFSCGTSSQLSGNQKLWDSNTFSYRVTPAGNGARAKLTLVGRGAHLGMAKVQNGGEITGGPVNDTVTYDILSMTHNAAGYDVLVVSLQAAGGVWWTYTLRTY